MIVYENEWMKGRKERGMEAVLMKGKVKKKKKRR